MKYYLYILQSEVKESCYVGVSEDPERRLGYHNSENKGHTIRYRPWKIVFTQEFDTKKEALAVEQKVKKWKSKKMVKRIVEGEIEL